MEDKSYEAWRSCSHVQTSLMRNVEESSYRVTRLHPLVSSKLFPAFPGEGDIFTSLQVNPWGSQSGRALLEINVRGAKKQIKIFYWMDEHWTHFESALGFSLLPSNTDVDLRHSRVTKGNLALQNYGGEGGSGFGYLLYLMKEGDIARRWTVGIGTFLTPDVFTWKDPS